LTDLHAKIPKEGRDLLDGRNFASLATLMKDGSPQVSPVWIDREGDTVLINTQVGRTKERNVARDPRVAISVFDMKDPYRKMLIRGKVAAMVKRGARKHIDELAVKYTGSKYKWMTPGAQRVILRIEPSSVNFP
jgi:PPOX class probable F420-dependent enzyme